MNSMRFATKTARAAASKVASSAPLFAAKRGASTNAFRQIPLQNDEQLFDGSRVLRGMGLFAAIMGIGQLTYGRADDVFEHKFTTEKNPQDLADFYGTEDFMEIFCIHPFIVQLMMRGSEFQDDGTIHSFGLFGPKHLQVSIEFDEHESEEDSNTVTWFNKREHFKDVGPFGIKLWEITQHFGYQQLPDGKCEVYHLGRDFSGFFPLRIIFNLHSKYVIWATKKYVNNPTFGSEDLDDEREEIRHNVPLHVLKEFLAGLSTEVEKAQDKTEVGSPEHDQLQVTLQRLKTAVDTAHSDTDVQLRTFKSRRAQTDRVQLVVDDHETKETIRRAMTQIGATTGQRHQPVAKMRRLTRRATTRIAPSSNEEKDASKPI